MQETPTFSVEETPVLIPKIRHDAFFYTSTNREFLRGTVPALKIPDLPTKGRPLWSRLPVVVVVNALLVIAFPYLVSQSPVMAVLIGACVLLLGFILLSRKWGVPTDQELTQHFLKDGQILEGELLSCGSFVGRGSAPSYIVETHYRFQNPAGHNVQGKTKTVRPDLNGVQLPAPGTPVYVLYFNDNGHYLL